VTRERAARRWTHRVCRRCSAEQRKASAPALWRCARRQHDAARWQHRAWRRASKRHQQHGIASSIMAHRCASARLAAARSESNALGSTRRVKQQQRIMARHGISAQQPGASISIWIWG
jgi:hypothetical protein